MIRRHIWEEELDEEIYCWERISPNYIFINPFPEELLIFLSKEEMKE